MKPTVKNGAKIINNVLQAYLSGVMHAHMHTCDEHHGVPICIFFYSRRAFFHGKISTLQFRICEQHRHRKNVCATHTQFKIDSRLFLFHSVELNMQKITRNEKKRNIIKEGDKDK